MVFTMDVFLVRVSQSVLHPYTSKEFARQMAELIVEVALENWNDIVLRYGTTDEITLMEQFTRECVRVGCLIVYNPDTFLS